MSRPIVAYLACANPFWATDATAGYLYPPTTGIGYAPGAGVTLSNTTAHPLGTTEGEYGWKFDGNSATHTLTFPDQWGGSSRFIQDSTTYPYSRDIVRGGYEIGFLFKETGSAAPGTDARICMWDWGGYIRGQKLYYQTNRKLRLEIDGVVVATTAAALTAGTAYWIEMVYESGIYDRIFVRLTDVSSPSGHSVVIDKEIPRPPYSGGLVPPISPIFGADVTFGEDVARGANFAFFIWNFVRGGIDLNQPPGIIRQDKMYADGVSAHKNDWAPANANNVDDTNGAAPDDATTFDRLAIANSTVKSQLYTVKNPITYVSGTDEPLYLYAFIRMANSVLETKTQSAQQTLIIYDGTTDQLSPVPGFGQGGGYWTDWLALHDDLGAAWNAGFSSSKLNAFEIGQRGTWTASSPGTANFDTTDVTAVLLYEKNGENLGAYPAARPNARKRMLAQAVNRAARF